jgi:hypothetical protein
MITCSEGLRCFDDPTQISIQFINKAQEATQ